MHMRPRSTFHAFTTVLGNVLVVASRPVLYEYILNAWDGDLICEREAKDERWWSIN